MSPYVVLNTWDLNIFQLYIHSCNLRFDPCQQNTDKYNPLKTDQTFNESKLVPGMLLKVDEGSLYKLKVIAINKAPTT